MESIGNITTYTYLGLRPRTEREAAPHHPLSAIETVASNVIQMPLRISFTVEGEPDLDAVLSMPSYTETVTTVYVHGRPREMSIHRRYHRSEAENA